MAEVIAQLEKQVASQKTELEYARLKIQVLEERLRLQRIQKYGPSSEKLSNLQLELLEQEPGVGKIQNNRAKVHIGGSGHWAI